MSNCTDRITSWQQNLAFPMCIGHRGAAGHAPENTLGSIARALKMGVDAIEVDVQACEGALIVLHDNRVDRTTNGSGSVARFSLASLRALDAGNGQSIPLLSEVLECTAGQACLNLELKAEGLEREIAALLDRAESQGWDNDALLVSSFLHPSLRILKQLRPRTLISALVEGVPHDFATAAQTLDALAIGCNQHHLSGQLVTHARQLSKRVLSFTANHTQEIQQLLQLGVDGIFSDFPERVLALRKSTIPLS